MLGLCAWHLLGMFSQRWSSKGMRKKVVDHLELKEKEGCWKVQRRIHNPNFSKELSFFNTLDMAQLVRGKCPQSSILRKTLDRAALRTGDTLLPEAWAP